MKILQSPVKQVKALASAVAGAFSRADLTPEESSSSVLKFDDLPWAAPPLICAHTIDDVPLSYYLDTALPIASEKLLHTFWSVSLGEIYANKRHIIQHGAFHNLRRVMPKSSLGQRALKFSVPSGFPVEMPDTVGVEFSLEAAHTALTCCAIHKHVEDDDNYYVVTSEGYTIGVQNGLPATPSPWDIPATGMIGEMLTMARGQVTYNCLYDQIARCRSLLHEYPQRFREFEALDYALQALRKMTLGAYCPALISAVQVAPMDVMIMRAKELALRQAMDVMQEKTLHDRAKILTINQLLVPLVMSASAFSQKVYNTNGPIPFSLSDKVIVRINAWLQTYYEEKIPANLKE